MIKTFKEKFQAAIEAFSKFNTRNDDCDYCPFYEEECAGSGDKPCLSEDVLKLLERGLDLEERISEWISPEERLPKDSVSVLAHTDRYGGMLVLANRSNGVWMSGSSILQSKVLYWMPAPTPPIKEEDK